MPCQSHCCAARIQGNQSDIFQLSAAPCSTWKLQRQWVESIWAGPTVRWAARPHVPDTCAFLSQPPDDPKDTNSAVGKQWLRWRASKLWGWAASNIPWQTRQHEFESCKLLQLPATDSSLSGPPLVLERHKLGCPPPCRKKQLTRVPHSQQEQSHSQVPRYSWGPHRHRHQPSQPSEPCACCHSSQLSNVEAHELLPCHPLKRGHRPPHEQSPRKSIEHQHQEPSKRGCAETEKRCCFPDVHFAQQGYLLPCVPPTSDVDRTSCKCRDHLPCSDQSAPTSQQPGWTPERTAPSSERPQAKGRFATTVGWRPVAASPFQPATGELPQRRAAPKWPSLVLRHIAWASCVPQSSWFPLLCFVQGHREPKMTPTTAMMKIEELLNESFPHCQHDQTWARPREVSWNHPLLEAVRPWPVWQHGLECYLAHRSAAQFEPVALAQHRRPRVQPLQRKCSKCLGNHLQCLSWSCWKSVLLAHGDAKQRVPATWSCAMQALHFALLHEPPQQRSKRRQLALLFLPWKAVKLGSSRNSRRPDLTFHWKNWKNWKNHRSPQAAPRSFHLSVPKWNQASKPWSVRQSPLREGWRHILRGELPTWHPSGPWSQGKWPRCYPWRVLLDAAGVDMPSSAAAAASSSWTVGSSPGIWHVDVPSRPQGRNPAKCSFLESLLPLNQSLQTAQKDKLPRIEQSDVQRASADRSSASWAWISFGRSAVQSLQSQHQDPPWNANLGSTHQHSAVELDMLPFPAPNPTLRSCRRLPNHPSWELPSSLHPRQPHCAGASQKHWTSTRHSPQSSLGSERSHAPALQLSASVLPLKHPGQKPREPSAGHCPEHGPGIFKLQWDQWGLKTRISRCSCK